MLTKHTHTTLSNIWHSLFWNVTFQLTVSIFLHQIHLTMSIYINAWYRISAQTFLLKHNLINIPKKEYPPNSVLAHLTHINGQSHSSYGTNYKTMIIMRNTLNSENVSPLWHKIHGKHTTDAHLLWIFTTH